VADHRCLGGDARRRGQQGGSGRIRTGPVPVSAPAVVADPQPLHVGRRARPFRARGTARWRAQIAGSSTACSACTCACRLTIHPAVFLEHGYTQFATEQILYRDQAAAHPEPSVNSALIRPARRDDIGPSTSCTSARPRRRSRRSRVPRSRPGRPLCAGADRRMGRDIPSPGRRASRHRCLGGHPAADSSAAGEPQHDGRGPRPALRDAIIDAVLAELPSGPPHACSATTTPS